MIRETDRAAPSGTGDAAERATTRERLQPVIVSRRRPTRRLAHRSHSEWIGIAIPDHHPRAISAEPVTAPAELLIARTSPSAWRY